jgi:uncharacterized protein (DUF1778 family)
MELLGTSKCRAKEPAMTTTTATASLDLRLDVDDKRRITKADAVVMLSEEESGRFLAALDAPFQPNQPLRQAMQNAAALEPR